MIRTKIQTGDYTSESDVVRDALRLWQRHQEATANQRVWLRSKLDRSLADPRSSLDAAVVFDELETRYRDGYGRRHGRICGISATTSPGTIGGRRDSSSRR
jgi:putative addiction module CopG family antidote